MKQRLEILGLENALLVVKNLIKSGYSVLMPFIKDYENIGHTENTYYIIEYIFTKYNEKRFIEEKGTI